MLPAVPARLGDGADMCGVDRHHGTERLDCDNLLAGTGTPIIVRL